MPRLSCSALSAPIRRPTAADGGGGVLVQARYGKGKLLICTIPLITPYGTDPYATYLLDALINYAASGFAPKLDLTPPASQQPVQPSGAAAK